MLGSTIYTGGLLIYARRMLTGELLHALQGSACIENEFTKSTVDVLDPCGRKYPFSKSLGHSFLCGNNFLFDGLDRPIETIQAKEDSKGEHPKASPAAHVHSSVVGLWGAHSGAQPYIDENHVPTSANCLPIIYIYITVHCI